MLFNLVFIPSVCLNFILSVCMTNKRTVRIGGLGPRPTSDYVHPRRLILILLD